MPGFIESKCVEIAASSILLLKLEAFRDLHTILFLPVGVVFAFSEVTDALGFVPSHLGASCLSFIEASHGKGHPWGSALATVAQCLGSELSASRTEQTNASVGRKSLQR